ncbi:MAG: hypothetical protein M3442_00035 [Chloroflexota bacterium]|nr:hypothetical protein [Chloroflexota bacterium]
MLAAVAQALPALARAVAGARAPFLRALGNSRPKLAAFAERAAAVLPAADPRDGIAADAAPGQPVRPQASPTLAPALDRLHQARSWQGRYLEQLRRQPALGKVKLERTSTQGLFLEVPVNTPVPADWVRRGGVQRAERYSTAALEEHAVELAEAETLVAAETKAVLNELRTVAATAAAEARELARHLAATDALLSLALVAAERGWVCPTVDEGDELEIEAGRHPVVEERGPFQPNDARLQARGLRHQLVVLTGPNMAGKSTWMRQVAVLTVLAQVGSFVPARRAHVGLVDAIYTRIGAVDDLAGGRSTFMVEMEETAGVLRGATDRSLILLDEIGRGTSTHDGMAIAWAVIEHLAAGPVRPRAIIATHYHELAGLGTAYPQLTLLRAAVDERADGVVFTHRIEPGAADRSFGIEVARLAGLPPTVLTRARQVADAVEPLSAEIAERLGGLGRTRSVPTTEARPANGPPAGPAPPSPRPSRARREIA